MDAPTGQEQAPIPPSNGRAPVATPVSGRIPPATPRLDKLEEGYKPPKDARARR